jgi:tRNA threonylcarbamoyladenosine biosynthesis protein TsaE
MNLLSYQLPDIDLAAAKILHALTPCRVFVLTGSLGAGKTTLSSALLRLMGVAEPVISPTFTYVNHYQDGAGHSVYHFDLYRIKTLQEFENLGFFEYFEQPNSLVLIEWPEVLLPVLGGPVGHIKLTALSETERLVEYELKGVA